MDLLQKIFSNFGGIIGIIYLLSALGVGKKLKRLLKTEEEPSNHKQETRKIQAEIYKAKTKSEKTNRSNGRPIFSFHKKSLKLLERFYSSQIFWPVLGPFLLNSLLNSCLLKLF